MNSLSEIEDAQWEARYEAVQEKILGVHDELGELISQQLWDLLCEYFPDNPAVNWYYNTQEMTKDAMFVIVPLLEDIIKGLKL